MGRRLVSGKRSIAVVSLLVVPLFGGGCKEARSGGGEISPQEFETVELAAADGQAVGQLTDQLDLLRTIFPAQRDDQLEGLQSDSSVLGRAEAVLPDGRGRPVLLLYEAGFRSILSVDLCPECTGSSLRSIVTLHYNGDGLTEELRRARVADVTQASLSVDVAPIALRSGWVLATEAATGSLLAFKPVQGFRTDGAEVSGSPNFGRGNGLVMSVVITGGDMSDQLGFLTPRSISRLFEMEDGRVLVFFRNLREIHVLRLLFQESDLNFDLGSTNPRTVRTVQLLKGEFQVERDPDEPGTVIPPVVFDDIADVTQVSDVTIDTFQPITVPADGSILLYEAKSAGFVRIKIDAEGRGRVLTLRDDPVGVVPGSQVSLLLGRFSGLTMGDRWYHRSNPEILVVEESTDTVIAYNYKASSPRAALRIFVPSEDIQAPVDPSGRGVFLPGTSQAPSLVMAVNDVGTNRLAYDVGRDQLLAISYDSGEPEFQNGNLVVLVAQRTAFEEATGRQLADLVHIERLPDDPEVPGQHLRAWDVASTSLLKFSLAFTRMPVRRVPD